MSDEKSSEKSLNLQQDETLDCTEEEKKKLRDFYEGDHVIRWTWIGIYPVQVHGIVLSSYPDCVTIVDCGLTAASPQTPKGDDDDMEEEFDDDEYEKIEREIKKSSQKRRRLCILSLFTDDPEIKKWHKIHYQPSFSESKEESCTTDEEENDDIHPPELLKEKKDQTIDLDEKIKNKSVMNDDKKYEDIDTDIIEKDLSENTETNKKSATKEEVTKKNMTEEHTSKEEEVTKEEKNKSIWFWKKNKSDTQTEKSQKKNIFIPQSDPVPIVLERIRFLLNRKKNDDVLPPHHVLYANSECIAVWCKTGTFSTLQASVFLHSAAFGQAKSVSTMTALLVGQTITVTTTTPAGGFFGLFGATTTTTTQVGLLSAQPWIIPVLAGYTVLAIGTPFLLLHKCRQKWRDASQTLNDSFWFSAPPHVYLCAIDHWSHLSITNNPQS